MAYAIYQDLQDRLGFTLEPDEQNLVTQLIREAESFIDFYTGKNFNENDAETDVFDGAEDITQWTVRYKPLISVTSIVFNGNTLTVDTDYAVYLESSTIRFNTTLDSYDRQNVTITYKWGRTDVPPAIRNICLEMVSKSFICYQDMKNLKGADKITIGDITTSLTKEVMLTPKIERMLDRFRSVSLRVI
jgi:hypothetical protein